MEFNHNSSLAKVINTNPELLMVLERLGIFPGFQEKTIGEISITYGISTDLLATLLNMHIRRLYKTSYGFKIQDIRTIINYLRHSHDFYINELYPAIAGNIQQLVLKSSGREMKMVETFFEEYRQEVDGHFAYENITVFPYIMQLYNNLQQGDPLPDKKTFSVKVYKNHHYDIEDKLDDLKNLLVNHIPPDPQVSIRRRIILDLAYLEKDINIHSNIENTILIPLVEQMEQNLSNKNTHV